MPLEPIHRPELDGLRGAAAWMVVLTHVTNQTGLWGTAFGFGGGQLGVMLFFVLSGYLMGALYLDRPFDLANLRDYAVRRFARVIPLYYGLVLLSFVLMATIGVSPYAITLSNLYLHLGLISGISVFWTIPIEIHFYFVFVFFWWLYRRSPSSLIVLSIVMIAAFFFFQSGSKEVSGWLTFYIAFFLSGMLVSRLPRLAMPDWHWSALFLLAVGVFLLTYPGIYLHLFGQHRWLWQIFVMEIWHDPLYLVTATGILLTSLYAPVAKVLLGNRVMQRSGDISFSVYLLHTPVIWLLARSEWLMSYPTIFLLATFAVTAALAYVSFRTIELPARRWIRSHAEYRSRVRALAPIESAR